MRGGKGGVNYTSGSLARANAKSKSKTQSPHRLKYIPNNALFPQKTLLANASTRLDEFRSQSLSQAGPPEIHLEAGVDPEVTNTKMSTKREAQLEETGYSRSAMPRSPRSQEVVEREKRHWWNSINAVHPSGRGYIVELDKTAKDQNGQTARLGYPRQTRMIEEMLGRGDFLELPLWSRSKRRSGQKHRKGQGGLKG